MKLHNYFRSSAAFRVRIALGLKGLAYDYVPVHLVKGEQRGAAYLATNPQGLVPALELDDGKVLAQSLAIMEYLDEMHPEPSLVPGDPLERHRVRALALSIACDIHPLNNSRVLAYLRGLELDQEAVGTWYCHWIGLEFAALEKRLSSEAETGAFCHGDAPTLADLCLVPQVFNAQRFNCSLDPYPTIMRIHQACMALPAFRNAAPSAQPDAEG